MCYQTSAPRKSLPRKQESCLSVIAQCLTRTKHLSDNFVHTRLLNCCQTMCAEFGFFSSDWLLPCSPPGLERRFLQEEAEEDGLGRWAGS